MRYLSGSGHPPGHSNAALELLLSRPTLLTHVAPTQIRPLLFCLALYGSPSLPRGFESIDVRSCIAQSISLLRIISLTVVPLTQISYSDLRAYLAIPDVC